MRNLVLIVVFLLGNTLYAKKNCKDLFTKWQPNKNKPLVLRDSNGKKLKPNPKKKVKTVSAKNCNGIKSDLIQDASKHKWFWSKDNAGHSDCAWKVFEYVGNNEYEIKSCADEFGNLIKNKHESTSGKRFRCK